MQMQALGFEASHSELSCLDSGGRDSAEGRSILFAELTSCNFGGVYDTGHGMYSQPSLCIGPFEVEESMPRLWLNSYNFVCLSCFATPCPSGGQHNDLPAYQ